MPAYPAGALSKRASRGQVPVACQRLFTLQASQRCAPTSNVRHASVANRHRAHMYRRTSKGGATHARPAATWVPHSPARAGPPAAKAKSPHKLGLPSQQGQLLFSGGKGATLTEPHWIWTPIPAIVQPAVRRSWDAEADLRAPSRPARLCCASRAQRKWLRQSPRSRPRSDPL